MKHFFSVCLLLVVFCNGVAADDLWLIKDGQPFATIVGPEKATPWQTKAAESLVNYADSLRWNHRDASTRSTGVA